MSEDAAIVELVPDVELGALMARVTSHAELDAAGFEQGVTDANAAQRSGDYAGAVSSARTLLAKLVRDIAYELRRSPGESLEVFWARSRPAGEVQQHWRFLVHQCFLNEREAQHVERATTIADTPGSDSGVSLAAWSRLARQMVYAAADLLLTRYAAWRAGCTCEGGVAVDVIVFQPPGDGPKYERAICRRCRCPREAVPATKSPEADASNDASPTVVRPIIKVSLIVARESDVEVWPEVTVSPPRPAAR